MVFLLVSLIAEYYIAAREVPFVKSPFWRALYKWLSIVLWVWSVGMLLLFRIFPNLSEGLYRFFEGTTPIFIFMCVSKIIFALFAAIGRRTSHRNVFYTTAVIIILIVNCIMTYAATTGRWNIRIARFDMVSAHVPDHLDGFRIAVFSDVHAATTLDRHVILRRMVDEINALDADIVINCGDLVNRHYTELEPEILEILDGIESTYGVYSAVGNHDMGKYVSIPGLTAEENLRRIIELQESIGWRVLIDETICIPVGNDTISVTGVSFPEELMHKKSHQRLTAHEDYSYLYADKSPGRLNVTIAHTPAVWEDILATGQSTLTLSGHVHAMQMKLKLGKDRYWSPARFFYKHWSGAYEQDGRYLYVNDGIGYSLVPMRFWAKPEVTLIELRKCR